MPQPTIYFQSSMKAGKIENYEKKAKEFSLASLRVGK